MTNAGGVPCPPPTGCRFHRAQWLNIHTCIPAGGGKAASVSARDLSLCIPAVGDISQERSVYAVGGDGFLGMCSLFHCKVYLNTFNVNCFREENLDILEDQASLMENGS